MLGLERREKIMEKLRQDSKVYVSELAPLFKVTEETIRRDLEKLEGEGLLRRSYGGAMLAQSTSEDLSFTKRSTINSASKEKIAALTYSLINDGDTIMVDSSTTCRLLLDKLKERKNITIITNSIRLMNDFSSSKFTMICTGGTLRANSYSLTGAQALRTLADYYVDFALISCKGLDIEKGVMESNESESEVKRRMIKQAREVVLLADHSKLDKTAFVKCADLSALTYLATDETPSEDWQRVLQENHVRLIS